MDSIGSKELAKDYVVAGTASESLYGACEAMFKAGMNKAPLMVIAHDVDPFELICRTTGWLEFESRKENLELAVEHESNGNFAAAYERYQKVVGISPAVAFQLIQVLKKENVDYIVAPYEADVQMNFLAISKHVEAVITEDSDFIPFGVFGCMLLSDYVKLTGKQQVEVGWRWLLY